MPILEDTLDVLAAITPYFQIVVIDLASEDYTYELTVELAYKYPQLDALRLAPELPPQLHSKKVREYSLRSSRYCVSAILPINWRLTAQQAYELMENVALYAWRQENEQADSAKEKEEGLAHTQPPGPHAKKLVGTQSSWGAELSIKESAL